MNEQLAELLEDQTVLSVEEYRDARNRRIVRIELAEDVNEDAQLELLPLSHAA